MKQSKALHIWNILNRIQQTLEISDPDFSEMLLLSKEQLKKKRLNKQELFFSHLANLSEILDLTFDRLSSGRIDYGALVKQFKGLNNYLPERYIEAALSRRRTSVLMLDYLQSIFGWEERLRLLKHFQVSESILVDPDQFINIRFPSDICAYLNRFKFDVAQMIEMGLHTARACIPEPVRLQLTTVKNVAEIYEMMCQELIGQYYDRNCEYKLASLQSDECIIDVIPKIEVCEKLRRKTIGNPALSIFRRGVAASYPLYVNLPPAEVKHVASIFNGDASDRYVINYAKAAHVFNHKKKFRLISNPDLNLK